MSQIFISYKREEKSITFVKHLMEKLESNGFDVWVDQELLRPGQDWKKEIDNAIKASLALIIVMTPEAFESKYVTYEWAFAIGRGMEVIPLLFEATAFHPRLEDIQYIDFTNHFALDGQWQKLIDRLEELRGTSNSKNREIPPFIKKAVEMLDSYDSQDREAAIDRIMQSSHPSVTDTLANAVQHHIDDVRMYSAIQLAERTNFKDSRCMSGLIEAIDTSNNNYKSKALRYLACIGNTTAVNALLDALHRGKIGYYGVKGIFDLIDNSEAIPIFIEALLDENESVFRSAIIFLNKKLDVRSLVNLLKNLSRDNFFRAYHAAELLGNIGDPSVVDDLAKNLVRFSEESTDTLSLRSHRQIVCNAIIRSLQKIGSQKAMAIVEKWQPEEVDANQFIGFEI